MRNTLTLRGQDKLMYSQPAHSPFLPLSRELQEVRKELQTSQEAKTQLEEHLERLEKNLETLTKVKKT